MIVHSGNKYGTCLDCSTTSIPKRSTNSILPSNIGTLQNGSSPCPLETHYKHIRKMKIVSICRYDGWYLIAYLRYDHARDKPCFDIPAGCIEPFGRVA